MKKEAAMHRAMTIAVLPLLVAACQGPNSSPASSGAALPFTGARTPAMSAAFSKPNAQQLDLIAYSANGYASVAFPTVAAAIGTGRQSDVDAASRETVTALGNIVSLLSAH